MPSRSRSRSRPSMRSAKSRSWSRRRGGRKKTKEIYYEPIIDLYHQYLAEFLLYYEKGQDYFEDYITKTYDKSKESQTALAYQKQQFLATITDQSAVPFQYKFLMETYVWLALLFLGYEGGQLLGRHLFGRLLNWMFTSWLLALLAFIILPLMAHLYFMYSEESDVKQRYKLLLFATALGIITGTIFSHLYFEGSAPTTFLAPFIIGINAQVFGPSVKDNNREMFHLLTLGCAFVIDLIWMIIKDSVNTTYLLLLSLDIGLLYAHMQYFLKRLSIVWEPWNEMHSWQLMALSVTHIIHSTCDYSLGWEHEQGQLSSSHSA